MPRANHRVPGTVNFQQAQTGPGCHHAGELHEDGRDVDKVAEGETGYSYCDAARSEWEFHGVTLDPRNFGKVAGSGGVQHSARKIQANNACPPKATFLSEIAGAAGEVQNHVSGVHIEPRDEFPPPTPVGVEREQAIDAIIAPGYSVEHVLNGDGFLAGVGKYAHTLIFGEISVGDVRQLTAANCLPWDCDGIHRLIEVRAVRIRLLSPILLLVLLPLAMACGGGDGAPKSTATAAATSSATQPAGSPVRPAKQTDVTLGYIPILIDAPFFVGIEKGYFADEGINLKLERLGGGADMLVQTAAGNFDIGAGGIGAAVFNAAGAAIKDKREVPVSYTHLTLPTNREV